MAHTLSPIDLFDLSPEQGEAAFNHDNDGLSFLDRLDYCLEPPSGHASLNSVASVRSASQSLVDSYREPAESVSCPEHPLDYHN